MKEMLGYNTLQQFRNVRSLLLMAFFDMLFFASLYAAASLFDAFFIIYQTELIGTWKGIISLTVYFLLVIFAYSFFKYCVLHFLSGIYGDKTKKLSFVRLKNIYIYNIYMFFVLIGIFIGALFFFTVALETVFQQTILQAFFVLYTLFVVFFIQTSHAIFFQNKNLLIQLIPARVWKYRSHFVCYLGWNTVFIASFLAVFLIFGLLMEYTGQQALASQNWYIVFFIFNIITLLYIIATSYFLIVWNRMYIYALIQKKKME